MRGRENREAARSTGYPLGRIILQVTRLLVRAGSPPAGDGHWPMTAVAEDEVVRLPRFQEGIPTQDFARHCFW